jgi:hypothetical protein
MNFHGERGTRNPRIHEAHGTQSPTRFEVNERPSPTFSPIRDRRKSGEVFRNQDLFRIDYRWHYPIIRVTKNPVVTG